MNAPYTNIEDPVQIFGLCMLLQKGKLKNYLTVPVAYDKVKFNYTQAVFWDLS